MRPVTFVCRATLPWAPEVIAGQMLDLAQWSSFTGYGPLPGIRSATFEHRTPQVAGTRIRVANTDGSSHLEEIVEWAPERRVQLEMRDFAPPLSRLATHFEELWEFERRVEGTHVVRSFRLHPASRLARPLLQLVALLLRRAVARHLRQLAAAPSAPSET